MRVWDIPAGYLNRQSLLAEHRELHGLYSIVVNGKKGYSRHPETLRWVDVLSGLTRRHDLLVAEMLFRGYSHHTPIAGKLSRVEWPETYVTGPAEQYSLLAKKYLGKEPGRIPLPSDARGLWLNHKYSVMARDAGACRTIGRRVARMRNGGDVSALAEDLVMCLRQTPSRGGVAHAVEYMWESISSEASPEDRMAAMKGLPELLAQLWRTARRLGEGCLLQSTAISELAVFCHPCITGSSGSG